MHIFSRGLVRVFWVFAFVLSQQTNAQEKQILPSVVRIQVIVGQFYHRGTGVAVDGGVITAAHVVEKSNEVSVICGDGDDGTAFDGDVVYRDSLMDLAFIKIKNDFEKPIKLPSVKLDTTFPPTPGMPVYAIGNSLGFTRTVSTGIVSASGTKSGEKFLYSDVLVRKGNSGGPLINHKGDMIGIVLGTVNAVAIGQQQDKDLGQEFTYCVPAIDVVKFMESMVNGDKKEGYLGVIGKQVATGVGQPGCDMGLQITRVVRSCGLAVGDIVFMLQDTPITSQRDMVRVVRSLQPGTAVKADVLRNGQFTTVEVSVTKSP
jgi:S1-C subfamily serine protease